MVYCIVLCIASCTVFCIAICIVACIVFCIVSCIVSPHLADGLRLLVVSDFGGEDRIELHRLDGSQPAAVLELEPESLGRVEELCPHPHDRGVVALTNHR